MKKALIVWKMQIISILFKISCRIPHKVGKAYTSERPVNCLNDNSLHHECFVLIEISKLSLGYGLRISLSFEPNKI